MSDVTILGLPPSSYVRSARMVATLKGVSHTLQPVDFRAEAYRQEHPFGKMPVLHHGTVRLFETLAIATYLDETFEGPALQPTTPLGRARMLQWISVTNDDIYSTVVNRCVAERFIKPMRGLEPDEKILAEALPDITRQLAVLNEALNDGPYICGPQLTLADIFLAPVLHYLAATPEGKSTLPAAPNVLRWQEKMQQTTDFEMINALGS